MAIKFSKANKIGYLGLDVVIDQNKGPMLIEANVRPGIAIQIANNEGLKSRLELIDEKKLNNKNIDEVEFIKKYF
jgi:glutathione synthase/RimK-type ligase-like ATP-grasp enzyme